MTPAEELTAAADRLDELASGAVQGWQLDDDNHLGLVSITTPSATFPFGRYRFTGPDDATTNYIAAMDPRVGRQLALLMRVSAEALVTVQTDEQRDVVYDKPGYVPHPLLSIARMINGGDE